MARPPQLPHRLGRLKRAARRLFWLRDVISTGELAAVAYPRKGRCTSRDYERMRGALAAIAVAIGRGGGQGRPTLWRKRNSEGE